MSSLPAIRRRTGNEDVAPPVWLNPVQSSLGGGTPPLNQAELRDGRRRCCTGRPNGEAAFDAHEPTRGLARRANPCERIPTDRAHRRASHEREGPENTFPPITMRSDQRRAVEPRKRRNKGQVTLMTKVK